MPQQEDLGAIMSVLQVDNRSVWLSADLDKLVRLGNLFCASKERKGDVGAELGLAATITPNVKCRGMFQDASSGAQGGMIEELAQTDATVLVDGVMGWSSA